MTTAVRMDTFSSFLLLPLPYTLLLIVVGGPAAPPFPSPGSRSSSASNSGVAIRSNSGKRGETSCPGHVVTFELEGGRQGVGTWSLE